MWRFLLFFFLCAQVSAQSLPDYMKFIEQWEGFSPIAYVDAGQRTIGIGHQIKSGENFNKINREEALEILTEDTLVAWYDAQSIVTSFKFQPPEVKLILVDLSFNLGAPKFKKFMKFLDAIEKRDYNKAADELVNSLWYEQTGRRARNHVKTLKLLKE